MSATAVTLLMLVIGGNTTIFSVVHGLMTKPAPGVQADRLVSLEFSVEGRPLDYERDVDSYPNYVDIAAEAQTIRPLLAFQFERFTLVARDGSYAVSGALASPNYFDVLGVRLAKGRPIADDERRAGAAGLTAVISHRVWQTHFRGAGDVLGQSIVLNGHPATIAGIAPPRFQFGVRMALGASPSQILRAVMREGLRWTAAGLALGFGLSLAAGAALGSLLFGITPTDRVTYAGVFSLLAATSLATCYLPARRAARIDPIEALRQE